MPTRLSCRSCQHCLSAGTLQGRCRLRQLDVHPEVADMVVCHHWTARSPELPSLGIVGAARTDHQLELDRSLA